MSWREVPCKQRLHFHCVSCCEKSSLCQQPFNFLSFTVQFSLVHARNSSCNAWWKLIVTSVVKIGMSFTEMKNWDNSVLLRKTRAIVTQCSKPVKNRKKPNFWNLFVQVSGLIWTVVSRGYLSHTSSQRENVASADNRSTLNCYVTLLTLVTPY